MDQLSEYLHAIDAALKTTIHVELRSPCQPLPKQGWTVALITDRNNVPYWLNWYGATPAAAVNQCVAFLQGDAPSPQSNSARSVTPNDFLNAPLDVPTVDRQAEAWASLKGNVFVKRALEVALAGRHTLTVIGHPKNGQTVIETILPQATFLQPCICGYYEDRLHKCTCSVEEIAQYRRRKTWQLAIASDILIELILPTTNDYITMEESFEVVQQRIATMRSRPAPETMDSLGWELLRMAIKTFGFVSNVVERMRFVAGTIAALDGSLMIQSYHIAEAIQYQSYDRKS